MSLYAKDDPGKPVTCRVCGQVYPQDPPFEVTCPDCGARPGTYCRRPSGHQGPLVPFHASRDLAAKAAGFYGRDCVAENPKAVEPEPEDELAGLPLFS